MSRPRLSALLAGLLLVAPAVALAQAVPPAETVPAPAQTAQPITIDGFRSAHFGMTEAEVRKAIEEDFKLSGTTVHIVENPIQRTRALSVIVPALVPESGKATIDYVLGFHSQKLVQVNINWSTSVDPANKATTLVQIGGTLQGYFQSETFLPGKAVSNAVLPNGGLLLFRGTDPAGHTVVLLLGGSVQQDVKEHKAQMTPTTLSLAYVADPAHPDVFQLQKGTF
jgi:hypothetical protein